MSFQTYTFLFLLFLNSKEDILKNFVVCSEINTIEVNGDHQLTDYSILQNIIFYVQQQKETYTGLVWNDMRAMTSFIFEVNYLFYNLKVLIIKLITFNCQINTLNSLQCTLPFKHLDNTIFICYFNVFILFIYQKYNKKLHS